jgi:hypothetical protein
MMNLQTKSLQLLFLCCTLQIIEFKDFYKATNFITTFIQLLLYLTIILLDFGLWPNYSLKIFEV